MARSILVVDHERAVRGPIEDALRDEGYAVRGADDGPAALAEVARAAPDPVVCGQQLPRLCGRSLVARLRSAGAGVPVVVVGAAPERAAGPAAAGVVPKPFGLVALRGAVARALGPARGSVGARPSPRPAPSPTT